MSDVVGVAESIGNAGGIAIKDVASAASGIALATLPPPKFEQKPLEESRDSSLDLVLRWVVFGVAVLVTTGIWMAVVHRPEGWSAHTWLFSLVGRTNSPGAWIVSILSIASGVWLLIRFFQFQPRIWARVIMSMGLIVLGVPTVSSLIDSQAQAAAPSVMWAWALALTLVGLGAYAMQRAWSTWERRDPMGKALATSLAMAATVAVLVGVGILRSLG
jgi:hypothetical protein